MDTYETGYSHKFTTLIVIIFCVYIPLILSMLATKSQLLIISLHLSIEKNEKMPNIPDFRSGALFLNMLTYSDDPSSRAICYGLQNEQFYEILMHVSEPHTKIAYK